jgi:hypothetical protein
MIITMGSVRVEVSRAPRGDQTANWGGEIRRAYEGLRVEKAARDERLAHEMEVSEYLPMLG